jgi:predicted nucleotidyltransferase
MREKLHHILPELRRALEALYCDRLVHLVLYGSQARGDAEEGSDIDVLVVLTGEVSSEVEIERTLDDVVLISLKHDEVITCVFISEEQFLNERSPLLLNVRREGVPV